MGRPRLYAAVLMLVYALALVACGRAEADRVASGAGAGVVAGAIAGAVLGAPGAVSGAVIGAAAGAAVGYVTDPEQIDLGEPVWR